MNTVDKSRRILAQILQERKEISRDLHKSQQDPLESGAKPQAQIDPDQQRSPQLDQDPIEPRECGFNGPDALYYWACFEEYQKGGDPQLHPPGFFKGTITKVKYFDASQTPFGSKPRLKLHIESDPGPNGSVFHIDCKLYMSSPLRSQFDALNRDFAGQHITDVEKNGFEIGDFKGQRLGYQVEYSEASDGRIWGNLKKVWKLEELGKKEKDCSL